MGSTEGSARYYLRPPKGGGGVNLLRALWTRALQFGFVAGGVAQLLRRRDGRRLSSLSLRQSDQRFRLLKSMMVSVPDFRTYRLAFEGRLGDPPSGCRWDDRSVRNAIVRHFVETDHVAPWEVVVIIRRKPPWTIAFYCRSEPRAATARLLEDIDRFCREAVLHHQPTRSSDRR